MFSISKIAVLIAIIAVVIGFFKLVGNMEKLKKRADNLAKNRSKTAPNKAQADDVEDLMQCRVCNTFVASKGAKACGREDCPYG